MKKKILVVGDAMIDRYLSGTSSRLSPEAPVPVVSCPSGPVDYPGGAAHVATAVAALGRRAGLISLVGDDDDARNLAVLLSNAGVWYMPSTVLEWRTPRKTRVVVDGQQICRVDEEDPPPTTPQTALLDVVDGLLPELAVMVLSDYAKGTLEYTCRRLLHRAFDCKIPCLVDPKNKKVDVYDRAFAITPNFAEAAAAVRQAAGPLPCATFSIHHDASAEHLAHSYGAMVPNIRHIIIKRGKYGCTWKDQESKTVMHVPAVAGCAYDPTGAGDVFIAALAVGVYEKKEMSECIRMAVTAASISVGASGTSVVCRDVLDQALGVLGAGRSKIMSAEAAGEWVKCRHMSGEVVVFTNGCFDIFHPGHLETLRYAKSLGAKLIVGVNSDESVRAIKGEGRPYIPDVHRMAILAELSCVDVVVPFSEATPEKLIRTIRPDVLVKGEEYRGKVVVGADFVASHGGLVEFAPMFAGMSTTELARTILRGSRQTTSGGEAPASPTS